MSDWKRLARAEVLELLDMAEDLLAELERAGLVAGDAEGVYEAPMVDRIRVCCTLHRDLGVNVEGVEVALHLLEVIEAERRQFVALLERLRAERG